MILKKFIPIFIYLFLISSEVVYAKSDDFEKIYVNAGYKTLTQAVKDSEAHFKREIALPTVLPPLSFTHHFGRFSDLEGNENDHLEITFLHEKSPEHHYGIRILPIGNKLEFTEEYIDQTFTLADGQEAIYSTKIDNFILFIFEKHGWQYILSIDQKMIDRVPPHIFVTIANSIQY